MHDTPDRISGQGLSRAWAGLAGARKAIGVLAAVGATVGGLAGYWNVYRVVREVPAPQAAANPTAAATRLSIVVLPFVNRTGDPAREAFVDALGDEVTSELSLLRESFVIAPGTAAAFKGRSTDARAVGRELDVRYLLEGSVRGSGRRLVVDTRLVDAASGRLLAADSAEVASGLFEDLRLQIAGRVADTLGRHVVAQEARRARAVRHVSLEAQDWRVLGRDRLMRARTQAEFDEAYALYGKALAADPAYEPALDGQALAIALNMVAVPAERQRHPERLAEADRKAAEAIALDPGDPDPHFTRALVRQLQGRLQEGLAEADLALELNPSLARAHAVRGSLLLYLGQPGPAAEPYRRALALSPREIRRDFWLAGLCRAQLLQGRFADSVEACEAARALAPADLNVNLMLAAAYAELGDGAKAAEAKSRVLLAAPGYKLPRAAPAAAPAYEALRRRFLRPGLLKAGFEEAAGG